MCGSNVSLGAFGHFAWRRLYAALTSSHPSVFSSFCRLSFLVLVYRSYRTREEIQEVRQTRDPITSFKDKIITAELVTSEELKKLEQEVKQEVDAAGEVAKAGKEVPLGEMYGDIYVNPLVPDIRGTTPFSEHKHLRVNQPFNLN
ncbi:unnamed protein product [Ixodes pacificus]